MYFGALMWLTVILNCLCLCMHLLECHDLSFKFTETVVDVVT